MNKSMVLRIVFSILLAGCSGGGGSTSSTAPTVATGISLLAGNIGGRGSLDGTVSTAHFLAPSASVFDAAGNLYVADMGSNTIRKITPAGVVSTFAGTAGVTGSADGTGAAASFNRPWGITIDATGNLYVVDSSDNTIRKITSAGVVSTFAGTAGVTGSADGTGAAASFNRPWGITIDAAGNLFVADTFNSTIRKITQAGVVSTFAGTAGVAGSTDGTGAAARVSFPSAITIDAAGNLYVVESGTIRKITPAAVVSTFAGSAGVYGSADGTGAAASFYSPWGITIDVAGNLFVADSLNNTIRKISPAAVVSTFAGTAGVTGSTDDTGAAASFYYPMGITIDAAGNLYVADFGNSTIRKITSSAVVSTYAGSAQVTGSTDGAGTAAKFNLPTGMKYDASGNLYVADTLNNTIRKITPAGVVSTLAGTAGVTGSTNGSGAAASFNEPVGITIDATGNLYVVDSANRTIRKITPAGVVSTFAGTAGATGSADGNGAAASFNEPMGITIDATGNLYVADSANSTIRKVTPAGVVSTFAGTAGVTGSANGTGAAASFYGPVGITIDVTGNLYVADAANNTIRKITTAAVVSTFAGAAGVTGSADGTGAAAQFNLPFGMAFDASGNLYVTDVFNHTIRQISPAGAVTTVAGVATQGGVVLGALPGGLSYPYGIAFAGGKTFVVSSSNSVLTLVLP